MIKLTVKFSSEYEVERVRETLGRLQWYRDNGYEVKLPEGIVVNPSANLSEDQVRDSVNREYNENDFKIQEAYLLENWHKVIDEASAEITKTSLTQYERIYWALFFPVECRDGIRQSVT